MADQPRPKVGDKDPDFAKREQKRREKEAAVKAQTPAAAAPVQHAVDSPEELGLVDALTRLITKHKDRVAEGGPGGQVRRRAVDRVVDEAINESKGDTNY